MRRLRAPQPYLCRAMTKDALLIFILTAAAACAGGCRSTRLTRSEQLSTAATAAEYRHTAAADTVVIRDSVVICLRGDTIRERITRERVRIHTVRDTLTRTDTVTLAASVTENTAPPGRRQSFATTLGWAAAMLLAGYLAISRILRIFVGKDFTKKAS